MTRLRRWLAQARRSPFARTPEPAKSLPQDPIQAADDDLAQFLAARELLDLTPATNLRVSVVVVLSSRAASTLLCLRALGAAIAECREFGVEVIVVDKGSSGRNRQLLECVQGIAILRLPTSEGFVDAVNRAVGVARGDLLLLLDNAAIVEPRAIVTAVERIDSDARIGAVGGKLLSWDGRLYEAGGIAWRDGRFEAYGMGDEPELPTYQFLREVDYCSRDFLLIRRHQFDRFGRFDRDHQLANYAAVDYCVTLNRRGYSVLFDPHVRVRRFGSEGQVDSEAALGLQAASCDVLRRKHEAYLAVGPEPTAPRARLDGRSRRREGASRILVIDDGVPLPWRGAGYPRAVRLLESLVRAGHDVTHYPLQCAETDWSDVYAALPDQVETMIGWGVPRVREFLLDRHGYYDFVMVSRPPNMEIVQRLLVDEPGLLGGARLVYDAEAVWAARDALRVQINGDDHDPAETQAAVEREVGLAAQADAIVCVSEAEAQFFESQSGSIHVVGHALEVAPTAAAFGDRDGFLFVGAMLTPDTPNTDSIEWFVREVWPDLVRALGSRAHLTIVGACDVDAVWGMASSTISVVGAVPDLRPFYEAARVQIVPTRFAAGIPHKAHEAAAHGVPIVATTLIADQLRWEDVLACADTPSEFAKACLALHEDQHEWEHRRQEQMEAVRRDCDPESFDLVVRELFGS